MRVLIPLVPLMMTGCVYTVVVEHETYDIDEPFSAVIIHNETGELSISGGDASPTLDVTYRYHANAPDLDWRVVEGTLHIETTCPKPHLTCSVDLALTAPTDLDVTAEQATGSIELRNLDGAFDIAVTTGSIGLHQLAGAGEVETTTGSIAGTDLELTSLVARSTTGSIDLVYSTGPTLLDTATTTGSVDLLVPGGRYDVNTSTSTGSVEVVGLVDDPGSDRRIEAHTETGSVRVIGYDPPITPYLPACAAAAGDAYTVNSASLAGDTLSVELEFSGGCALHDFTLCWPDQSFMESEPVQVSLELLHDDHDDSCDAIVIDTRDFDLTPLQQAWQNAYQQSSGTIVVHIDGTTVDYDF